MLDSSPAPRPQRQRRTTPVRVGLAASERWWDEKSKGARTPSYDPRPAAVQPQMQFPSFDPLEMIARIRYGLVAAALLLPLVFIARIDAARTAFSRLLRSPEKVAMECLADGQAALAVGPLRTAAAANPQNPALLRQLAVAAAVGLPGEARRCYNQLEKIGATTDADRAKHSMLLAKLKDFTGAKALLLKVTPAARDTSLTRHAWLALWQSAGDFAAAADALEKLLGDKAPVDVVTCLDLVEEAGRTPLDAATMDRLENLAAQCLSLSCRTGDQASLLLVASRLAAIPWHTARSRLEVSKALRSLPGNPPEYRLAAVRMGFPATVETSSQQALRTAWLEEITSMGGLSAEEKDRVAAYLQKQKAHELVADLVPAAEAFTEYPLFSRRIDSLLELGRWREVGAMCASPEAPAVLKSRVLSQSLAALYKPGPQTCLAERLLLDALNESREEKRPAACFATGCAALEHRLPELAGNAFAAMLDLSKEKAPAMEAIITTSRRGGMPVVQLLRAFEGVGAFSDETVQNPLIYLHLLANKDQERMLEVIRQRRQREPENTYLRFLESLARHQRGEYAQAAGMLVPLPRYRWHQGEAAVIAGIMAASGNLDRSAGLLSQIQMEGLFAEERQMAEPILHRQQSGMPALVSKADVRDLK